LSACLFCKAGPRILPAAAGGGQSKVSVRIFFEKSSDFVQDRQPTYKVLVSRLARGFAPRFGGRIFKQFPNEPIFLPSKAGRKAAIFLPKSDYKFNQIIL